MISELEFEDLMKEIRDQIETDTALETRTPFFDSPPIAANDNTEEWPLLPFPDGWIASC